MSITVKAPQVSLDQFRGTNEAIINQLTDTSTAILNDIIAPFTALYNTIKATTDTARTAADVARKAYNTSKNIMPATAQKLLRAADNAEQYYDKMNSHLSSIDNVYKSVLEYKQDAQNAINNADKHSKQWVADQVNWVINKVNTKIALATESINKKLGNLESNMKKKADKASETAKSKSEELIKQQTDQISQRQQSDTQQKASIASLKNSAPKSI